METIVSVVALMIILSIIAGIAKLIQGINKKRKEKDDF